jgi:hypothetical protein
MANTDLAVRIATIFDEAGLKKANKSIGSLEKKTKSLGRALGISLGVAGVAAFGRAAVKAFSEDEASAIKLTNAVKNLGLSFYDANITQFISDMEKASSIADDELRPAFQTLLTTTGSLTKSQELLNAAISASRGSGESLATTTSDLAKAYVGNTRGLQKYYLGLSKAQLAAMSFEEILAAVNKQFSGASAAYLETYAGRVAAINVAYGNLQETVGKSLVNAFMTLTGSATTSDLAGWIDDVARRMAGLVTSAEKFSFTIRGIFSGKNGDEIAKDWQKILSARSMANANPFDPANNSLTGYQADKAKAAQAKKLADQQAKLLKESISTQKKITAEQKKQAALKKAGSVFDMENAQLYAALQGKITDEEANRVKALMALNNDNATAATYYTNLVVQAQDATGRLAELIRNLPKAANPFADWVIPMGLPSIPATNAANVTQAMGYAGAGSTAMAEKQSYVINVAGSVVSEQGLIDAVRGGLNVASLSGSGSTVRRIGGF